MSRKLFTKIMKGDRITIPKELMEKYNIKEGSFVIFEEEDTTIKIVPAIVVEK